MEAILDRSFERDIERHRSAGLSSVHPSSQRAQQCSESYSSCERQAVQILGTRDWPQNQARHLQKLVVRDKPELARLRCVLAIEGTGAARPNAETHLN